MRFLFYHIREVLLCILLLSFSVAVAQESPLLIKSNCNSWRGIEITDDSEMLCITGEGVVQKTHVDSLHSILYVLLRDRKKGKLRKTGNLVAYDLKQDHELWNVPFNFYSDQFFLVDTLPVKSGKYYTETLDRISGLSILRVENLQVELVTKAGVGLAKKYKSIVGINLHTGEEIWQRPGGNIEEIGSFEIHGDTAAIFLSNGLNYINFNTGEGFKIKARTLERSPGMSVGGSIAMGLAVGIMFGMVGVAVIVIPNGSAYGGHQSDNTLTDMSMHKDGIIFTSSTDFYNVSYNGDIAWSVPLDKRMGPIRKVFVTDDVAYVISKGIINTENGPVYNSAMIYRMNLSGKESLIGVRLDTGTREYMQDFLVKDSTMVIALNNRIVEIRLDDLSTVQNQSFGISDQNVGFGTILNPPAFILNDSIFELASKKYPNDFFVENRGGMKIRFSEELSPVEVIRQPNYFALSQDITEQRMFVTNGTDVYLINTSGKRLGDFSFSPQMQYVSGRVFDYEDNRIVIIKL